jgi:nitroreductase
MAGILMLAAVERGLSTAPIIGFRPPEVISAFNIPDNFVPVMLMTIGYEKSPMPPRVTRLAFDDVAFDETFDRRFAG